MSEDAGNRLEAEGATLGEAKWAAVRDLGHRFPGITADEVSFEVLADSDEGALVGAEADVEAWRAIADVVPEESPERVRQLITRVVGACGLEATIDVDESAEEIRATVNGEDLGLLIGKHGSTIDALQHLAFRAAFPEPTGERKRVVVDAAGYRERRAATLHRAADRAVEDALSFSRSVELEPMTSPDRKIVHDYLADRTDVQTHSEGEEPERRLVVSPVAP
ncbi:MAG: KH domain-containing protein [Thermoleophilaceae bacterium]|nr:KH domain-containing protein [Thermoleophilaceae bacterium]